MKNYPFVMSGSIPSIAPSVIAGLSDARSLQNRTNRTLRVQELRFNFARASDHSAVDTETLSDLEIQLRIGNEPATEGFVPIVAMTWPADASEFAESGGRHLALLLRLSKPVLLAPGERITAQILNSGTLTTPFVEVSAVCEEANDPVGFMPWIAFYKSPVRLDGSGIYVDTSTEADLVNPFDSEMLVERFICRSIIGGIVDGINAGSQSNLPFDAVRVRMEDHQATQIIRDATPIGVVFDYLFRSWVVNAMLKSKGFYRVSVESKLSPQVVAGTPSNIQTVIGMLGYRAVR